MASLTQALRSVEVTDTLTVLDEIHVSFVGGIGSSSGLTGSINGILHLYLSLVKFSLAIGFSSGSELLGSNSFLVELLSFTGLGFGAVHLCSRNGNRGIVFLFAQLLGLCGRSDSSSILIFSYFLCFNSSNVVIQGNLGNSSSVSGLGPSFLHSNVHGLQFVASLNTLSGG